jgi:hypothetical protein
VIFQWFECTKRWKIIGFLDAVLWTRGHKWPQGGARGTFIAWKISPSVFTQNHWKLYFTGFLRFRVSLFYFWYHFFNSHETSRTKRSLFAPLNRFFFEKKFRNQKNPRSQKDHKKIIYKMGKWYRYPFLAFKISYSKSSG